jgi:hypothetical protein
VHQGPINHEASQRAHGTNDQKKILELPEDMELFCTRDPETARVAVRNFINCYQKSPLHYTIPLPQGDLTGLHDELGDLIIIDHWNSLRPGEESQVMVLRHIINPMPGEEQVTLVGWDMNRFAA